MKTLVIFTLCCAAVVLAEDGVLADECTPDVCKAADGCRCSTSESPLGPDQITPQLVSLTFDEAMTEYNYYVYWQKLLFDRVNPDQQPIGATFFVPHEYTDYKTVNDLYNYGFEIGVHSITNNNLQAYWQRASEELLIQEFGGQKHILSKFGNITEEDIIGVRTPQLELAGNVSIRAYQAAGFTYDNSWSTLSSKTLYPYTLDYLSTQQCDSSSACPNEAFKDFWILPINNINGEGYKECNTMTSCNVTGTADEIADWLVNEINLVRKSTRVPMTLLISSAWFGYIENSLEGFSKFLDKIATYDDVFLVTQKQVIDWTKNPVPLSEFKTEFIRKDNRCTRYGCKMNKPDNGQEIYFNSCLRCPDSYPWLGNPDGN